jgi:hypothetical protein
MGHQSYILPLNTEEEKKRILEVIRQHNLFQNPEDPEDDDIEVGEELTQICYVRLLKKKPKYLVEYTHAILCGNGGGRSHTFDWFADHDVNAFPFDSSMPKFVSAQSTWEIINDDGKVYKMSKKKDVDFELIDDYKWGNKEGDTTPTSKNEPVSTEEDDDILVYVGWLIHNQYLHQEGKLKQEVINALEKNEGWSWNSIPTDLVVKALIKMHEDSNCITRQHTILLDTLYQKN